MAIRSISPFVALVRAATREHRPLPVPVVFNCGGYERVETLRLLENNGWLADVALIYVESEVENGLPPVPACWHLYREKVAGQVAYRLYQREAKGENHAD